MPDLTRQELVDKIKEQQEHIEDLERWNRKMGMEIRELHIGRQPHMVATLYGIPFDNYRDFLIDIEKGTGGSCKDLLEELTELRTLYDAVAKRYDQIDHDLWVKGITRAWHGVRPVKRLP